MTCDILIEGAAVVTVDPEWRVFEPGYVAVDGGRIAGVGPSGGPEARAWEPRRRIDGSGRLVLPGFVNAHTHIAMAAFKGAGEDVQDRLSLARKVR